MKFKEHSDPEILIPRHITQFCLYTCQMILLESFISYYYGYRLLGIMQFILYLSSTTFWRKIKRGGIERIVDMMCVTMTLSYATYESLFIPLFYTRVWIISLITGIIIFIKNEQLFYYQVIQFYNKELPTNPLYEYHYFSTEYTNPNTLARELAYYRNVVTHGLVVHVGLSGAGIYCVMHNPFLLC